MSQYEAQQYADLVVEKLLEWNIIPTERYGKMNEAQREKLAELIVAKNEE